MNEAKGSVVLVDFHECNAKVSDSAAGCPHCGAISLDHAHLLPIQVSDLDMRYVAGQTFLTD
jgi:hypothetical protein